MLRGCAPIPGTLILGRAATLQRRYIGAKYLSSFTTGEPQSIFNRILVREQVDTDEGFTSGGFAPPRLSAYEVSVANHH
jgi:hypothetical protein